MSRRQEVQRELLSRLECNGEWAQLRVPAGLKARDSAAP